MPAPTPTSTSGRPAARILYAEDVPELRELARLILSRHGHQVDGAVDGVEAFEKITQATTPFDLVITDHHMPRMNGLQLVQRLREHGFVGRILVFSSELNPAVTSEYLRFGVHRVLFKPVFPSGFRDAVDEVFGWTTASASAPNTAR